MFSVSGNQFENWSLLSALRPQSFRKHQVERSQSQFKKCCCSIYDIGTQHQGPVMWLASTEMNLWGSCCPSIPNLILGEIRFLSVSIVSLSCAAYQAIFYVTMARLKRYNHVFLFSRGRLNDTDPCKRHERNQSDKPHQGQELKK